MKNVAPSSDPSAVPPAPPVKIDGPLTINTAAQWHDELMRRADTGRLVIDTTGVTECDSIGVQLLVSARWTMQARNGVCHVLAYAPGVQQAAARIGLNLEGDFA